MARTNYVKKSRKALICSVCRKDIPIGSAYKWVAPRYRAKVVAHENCSIPISMISSSKMASIWDEQNNCNQAVQEASELEDISSALRDLANTTRDVAEEYRESAQNKQEYFPDDEQASEWESQADELEQWADELEQAADDVENIDIDIAEEVEQEEGESDEDFFT